MPYIFYWKVNNEIGTSKCSTESINSIIYPETNAGSTATVACGEGFSGSYTRVCTAAGIWQNPTNNCGIFFISFFSIHSTYKMSC